MKTDGIAKVNSCLCPLEIDFLNGHYFYYLRTTIYKYRGDCNVNEEKNVPITLEKKYMLP